MTILVSSMYEIVSNHVQTCLNHKKIVSALGIWYQGCQCKVSTRIIEEFSRTVL